MKRIVVIMALLSIFLWCSNSVLAYTLDYGQNMDGHYTVSTEVTPLAGGFYKYDYAVTNLDQGSETRLSGFGCLCYSGSLNGIPKKYNEPGELHHSL